jgi:hypothetical protein
MPQYPADFRFAGVDGRGRQELIRDPRQGGSAVVRIEDPDPGREGYTFDLFWSNAGSPGYQSGYLSYLQGDGYYREREESFRRENWRGHLFQQVRSDLEYVASTTFQTGGDRHRFEQTFHELDELQGKLSARRYDERELDEVIGALQHVVRDNRLRPRDRDLLADDLNRLREFRARHDEYGARWQRY